MDVITIVLFLYCTIVGICYASFPLINIRSCIHYKKINNSTILCGFATNMKFPYDIDVGWLYYLHLFIQFYCGTTVTAKGVLFFGIVVGTQELIILQFSHLISKLKNVYCDNDFFNQKERLRHCIMYHIRIINLSDELNNSIALLTMPCLVTYNIIIGTSLLVVLNVPTPFSFMNTVGWIVSLFIGCISGERIIRASTAVGGVAYDLKWYADVRLRKDLQLMILRSQKPVRLQCGELGELSFIAFKKIMQGAYTLATMKSGIGR
nr:putative odorant receptor 92a [Onthophagus taurus]